MKIEHENRGFRASSYAVTAAIIQVSTKNNKLTYCNTAGPLAAANFASHKKAQNTQESCGPDEKFV